MLVNQPYSTNPITETLPPNHPGENGRPCYDESQPHTWSFKLLTFERGNPSEPKGHALGYVRNAAAPDEIHATYLIVPPIAIDLVKYMPPMFASNISLADMQNLSAIPLPPVPEKVESLDYLHRLAANRGDDLIDLGTMDLGNVQTVLAYVTDAAQEYLRSYTDYVNMMPAPEIEAAASPDTGSDDVMYLLMEEPERLGEMAKLVGKLRYAAEGNDTSLLEETAVEMEALGRYLSEKYRVEQIVQAARIPGEKGRRLSELHVTRCYKMCEEDYMAVQELEESIRTLEAQ